VTDERNHEDLGVDGGQDTNALEPEPDVAADLVGLPLGPVREVPPAIAATVAQAGADRSLVFGREGVDDSVRGVREATSVIKIEVGAGDLANVRGSKPSRRTSSTAAWEVSRDGRNAAVNGIPSRR
jgi:hypothetical protein